MNLPKPRLTGNISTHLRDLHDKVDRLKPQSAPGIITNATTRGVIRRPIRRDVGSRRRSTAVARWA